MLLSNLGIALAYFAIPAALFYFIRRRHDLAYRWVFSLFGMFIIACGLTHVVKIWTLYQPFYWLEAIIDSYTAIISLLTAFLLWPIIPQALALRSPKELSAANEKLELEVQARVLAEMKLRERADELAQANYDLENACEAALEASNLKSAFVANISHELRTPLAGIMGMNELLQKSELSAEQSELSNAVQDSARSLLAIVNDLLDLSKIEAGKINVESVPLNITSVVHDCFQVLTQAAQQKGLSLLLETDSDLPNGLYGDPVRLHQVLLNLVSNAVKFTLQGTVTVRVTVLSSASHQATIKIAVTDTGIGLSEQEQKYLFLPFSQVDNSSTRLYSGTGLGLAIAKRLVELMGGQIGIVSSKGQGSTFWFTVPFRFTASDLAPRPDANDLKGSLSGLPGKVLVVEDSPVLQQLVLRQLDHLGLQTQAVLNGKQALEAVESGEFSVILMDCNLPTMDGFQASRAIRQSETNQNRHVPIIAMTAGAMTGDAEKCLEAGMDDYISKPYTLEQLQRKLYFWLPKPKD